MTLRPLLFSALLAIAPAAAQGGPEVEHGHGCTLYHVDGAAVAGPYLALERQARRSEPSERVVTQGSATFDVTYTGFTPEARAAFQRAVDIWSTHLTSSVPIVVVADFSPLATNTLGSAGPFLARGAPLTQPDTWYPLALVNARNGADLFPSNEDIQATFSSSFSRFYFGLDGNPGTNEVDFVSVVLHELGHGLGFIGSGSVDDGAGQTECNGIAGIGCWGLQSQPIISPFIFDRFIEDGAGTALLNSGFYPNPSNALGNLLKSQDLFVDAPETTRVYGDRPPIWAPASFDAGSSFSHWDEVVIRNSSAALMTPVLSPGEAYQDPGDITCAFFEDMGWTLGADCDSLLPTASEIAPNDGTLALELVGPNPTRTATALRLTQAAPGVATVTLHDMTGRRVATLLDRPVGGDVRIPLPVGALAPGVYRVIVQTEAGARSQALTIVR